MNKKTFLIHLPISVFVLALAAAVSPFSVMARTLVSFSSRIPARLYAAYVFYLCSSVANHNQFPVFNSTTSCGAASRIPAELTRMKRAFSRS